MSQYTETSSERLAHRDYAEWIVSYAAHCRLSLPLILLRYFVRLNKNSLLHNYRARWTAAGGESHRRFLFRLYCLPPAQIG